MRIKLDKVIENGVERVAKAPSRAHDNVGDFKLGVLPASGWVDEGARSDAINYNIAEVSGDTIYMIYHNAQKGWNTISYYSREPFTIESITVFTTASRAGHEVHNHWTAYYEEDTGYYYTNDVANYNPDTINPAPPAFYTYKEFTEFTYRLIPWIKAKTTNEQQAYIRALIKAGVYAAEQIYKTDGMGKKKMEYVKSFLLGHGFDVNITEIEAAVSEYINPPVGAIVEYNAEISEE